jgi:branched-chain amino acid transport system permease protein
LTTVVNLIISATVLASIYALINVGFVLLYRTTGVINFAQGHFMLLGAFSMWALTQVFPYLVSLLITIVIIAALGAAIYLVLMRYLLGAKEFTKVITTLMLATILLQVPAVLWGTEVRILESPTSSVIHMPGAQIQVSDLLIVIEAAVVVIVLMLFVNRTVVGTRMRAVASDETLAIYAGIRVHWLAAIAWGLTGAGAALAGISYAQRSGVGLSIPAVGLGAFPAVIIGGMDSIGGSLIGGVIVAFVQPVTTYQFGVVYGEVISYLLMLGVLLVLPTGLFGSVEGRRL